MGEVRNSSYEEYDYTDPGLTQGHVQNYGQPESIETILGVRYDLHQSMKNNC